MPRPKAAEHVAAWLIGVGTVVAPWVAIRFVPVEVSKWASIYVAGALGGLALEITLGRGRLELPGPSVATTEEQEADERRPLGPLVDAGFLARVSSSGIAAVALLLVYHALVEDAATMRAFNQLATDPSTFGWGIFLGASSPAIWTASRRMVEARIAAVEAASTVELERIKTQSAALLDDMAAARDELTATSPVPTGQPLVATDSPPAAAGVTRALAVLDAALRRAGGSTDT